MRRPIKSRQAQWAQTSARWLAQHGIQPNHISLCSVVFAALGGTCLLLTHDALPGTKAWLFILTAVCIQLRLICNLLDGLIAVEGGLKSPGGEIFNDFPDRIADSLLFVSAGYAGLVTLPYLGWICALCAALTAYVRILGVASGTPAYFIGPMAKQHRMATLTTACLLAGLLSLWSLETFIIRSSLILISAGCLMTMARRLKLILHFLESKA